VLCACRWLADSTLHTPVAPPSAGSAFAICHLLGLPSTIYHLPSTISPCHLPSAGTAIYHLPLALAICHPLALPSTIYHLPSTISPCHLPSAIRWHCPCRSASRIARRRARWCAPTWRARGAPSLASTGRAGVGAGLPAAGAPSGPTCP